MTSNGNKPPSSRCKEELPVDRGWAWVICAAVFINHYVFSNSFQVLAVTLLDIKDEFDTSLTTVSLILMVKTLCMSFTAIISVNYLVPRFGLRKVLLLAGLVFCTCGVCYAFTSRVEVFIALATVRGITIGLINVPAVNLLGFYFKKRRSLATTIAVCGSSVSAISWPRLARYIMSLYDLKGTLLLNGALEGHMVLTALLLRPVLSYRPPANNSNEDASTDSYEKSKHFKQNNNPSTQSIDNPSRNQQGGDLNELVKNGDYFDDIKDDSNKDTLYYGCVKTTPLLEENQEKDRIISVTCDKDKKLNYKDLLEEYTKDDSNHKSRISCPDGGYSKKVGNPKEASSMRTLENSIHKNNIDCKNVRNDNVCYKSSPDVFISMVSRSGDGKQHDSNSFAVPRGRHIGQMLPSGHHNGDAARSKRSPDETFGHVLPNKSYSMSCIADKALDRQIGFTSLCDLGSGLSLAHSVLLHPEQDEATDGRPTTLWQKINLMFDFTLFKQWAFLWMLISAFPCATNAFVFTYLPTMATLKGISKDDGALLLVIVGAIELASRMVVGWIADTKYFKISSIIGFCCVCLGSIFLFAEFYNDFPTLVCMSVGLGLFVGIRSSLITVLFIEVFGLDNMAKSFSMFTVFIRISMAGHNPLLGHIMESVGVNVVMYYIGFSMILGGLIIYTVHIIARLDKARRQRLGSHGSSKSLDETIPQKE